MNTQLSNITIDEMISKSAEFDQHKADYKGKSGAFRFDDLCRLVGNPDVGLFGNGVSFAPLTLTERAYRQLFTRLGHIVFGRGSTKSLPADYMLSVKPHLRATNLNEHLNDYPKGDFLMRAFDDTCRAVLSGQYTEISNTELLDIVGKVMKEARDVPSYVVRYSSVTPDALNFRTIWKEVESNRTDNGGNNRWGIGVAIRNDETGGGFLHVQPLIKRGTCDNSITTDMEKFSLRLVHRGGSSIAKMVQVKTAMQEALPFAAKLLDKMIAADAERVPDFSTVLRGLALLHGWDDATSLKVAQGTENVDTVAGIVNGVTWAAHSIEDPNARMDMEVLGGNILLSDHNNLFVRAIRAVEKAER